MRSNTRVPQVAAAHKRPSSRHPARNSDVNDPTSAYSHPFLHFPVTKLCTNRRLPYIHPLLLLIHPHPRPPASASHHPPLSLSHSSPSPSLTVTLYPSPLPPLPLSLHLPYTIPLHLPYVVTLPAPTLPTPPPGNDNPAPAPDPTAAPLLQVPLKHPAYDFGNFWLALHSAGNPPTATKHCAQLPVP